MTRLLRPLLWVGGALLLVAALVGPFLRDALLFSHHRQQAEYLAEQISRLEEQQFQTRASYLPFTRHNMPEAFRHALADKGLATSPFTFDAALSGEGLVIRAMTRDELLQAGELPLMVFAYKKPLNSNKVVREWLATPH